MTTEVSPPRTLTSDGAAPQPLVHVDGIGIFAGTRKQAVERCLDLVWSRRGGRIATVNLDFLALARSQPDLRTILSESTVAIADGMPVVWLSRLAGARRIQRLAGVDLVRELCLSASAERELRIAIYGSTPAVCNAAVERLAGLSPQVRIVSVLNPPFRPPSHAEKESDLHALLDAAPHLVLVALGCPAQERLIAEWSRLLPTAVWIGVGGTLDFFAGRRKRAPAWAQRAGLEWLVRLAQEPRRLARRYLLRDIPALALLASRCLASRLGANASSYGLQRLN